MILRFDFDEDVDLSNFTKQIKKFCNDIQCYVYFKEYRLYFHLYKSDKIESYIANVSIDESTSYGWATISPFYHKFLGKSSFITTIFNSKSTTIGEIMCDNPIKIIEDISTLIKLVHKIKDLASFI